MKRLWKILLGSVFGLLIVLLIAINFTIGWRPFLGPRARPLTDRKFESTPARLERGRYLANNVSGCIYCHSEHEWTSTSDRILESKRAAGGVFPLDGLPGLIVAPNLTPDKETGAGTWTDDQLARAIREGIGHDGRALFPLMPYQNFRQLSDEDLASVIVYLRSLPAIRNPLPKTRIAFPVKYLIRNVPQPLTAPVPESKMSDPAKRGEHLALISGCSDCHTLQDHGQPIQRLAFAGGFVMKGPFGMAATANITPDPSGISYYDERLFIRTIRSGKVGARSLNPVMPWQMMSGMTDNDLKAIFAYLQTLKPVYHRVDNALPPTLCKICRQTHGAGDQN